MVLTGTLRRVFRRGHKGKGLPGGDLDLEPVIPAHFRCPVSLELMKDPVTLSTGITYDRESIERWVEAGNVTCPVTNQVLTSTHVVPNHAIRRMIQDWCVEHRSYGIERIPTPRIPVAPFEVDEVCSRITAATRNGDERRCRESVGKIRVWGRESERNKRCIVENGACAVLASAFDSFSNLSIEENLGVLEEILGVLPWMMVLVQEEGAIAKLGSESSLKCLIRFLNGQDLSPRQNAAMVLKEMPVRALAKTEGVPEALVKMIKEPIGSNSTKASLTKIFHLVSSSENKGLIAQKFVELGLVSLLLEAIVDSDRSICEKALGVLDCVCNYQEGKEIAMANALTLPLVVKKILRVSELATEFAVSILWKLCDREDEDVLIEAVQVGAFQKLLVLLQLGCVERTREKVTELLKLLNAYKSKAECLDSSLDLKHIKKSF